MRIIIAAFLALFLYGCATLDRPIASEFEPVANGFKFKAKPALIGYPADTEEGERVRIGWLEQYLAENKVCQAGYRITERTVAIGSFIYYSGECLH